MNMFRDFDFIMEGIERNQGNELEQMYIDNGKKIIDRYGFITTMKACELDQSGEIGELVSDMENRIKTLKIVLGVCEKERIRRLAV